MLAVTSYVSTDIAAVPLLWIVPLAIYLWTFAIAFGRRGARARALAGRALPLLVVPLALFMIARAREPLGAILLLHLGAFAAIALCCHGDLAADRPDSGHLTQFYFWLSLGGMLGGLFNTLLAPVVFSGVIEYPLVVVAGCVLAAGPTGGGARTGWRLAIVPAVVAVVTAAGTPRRARVASDAGSAARRACDTRGADLFAAPRRSPLRLGDGGAPRRRPGICRR